MVSMRAHQWFLLSLLWSATLGGITNQGKTDQWPLEICVDEPGWLDSKDRSCSDYVKGDLCTSAGTPGLGWTHSTPMSAFANFGKDASQACCGCGGSVATALRATRPTESKNLPASTQQGVCKDFPKWEDSATNDCARYVSLKLCNTDGTAGSGWDLGWGTIETYGNMGKTAFQACCGCGGGEVVFAKPQVQVKAIRPMAPQGAVAKSQAQGKAGRPMAPQAVQNKKAVAMPVVPKARVMLPQAGTFTPTLTPTPTSTPTSCLAYLNGAVRDCSLCSGECGSSSCDEFGLKTTRNCNSNQCPSSTCNYIKSDCVSGGGSHCWGYITCSDGSTTCTGYGDLCLQDGSSSNFKQCSNTSTTETEFDTIGSKFGIPNFGDANAITSMTTEQLTYMISQITTTTVYSFSGAFVGFLKLSEISGGSYSFDVPEKSNGKGPKKAKVKSLSGADYMVIVAKVAESSSITASGLDLPDLDSDEEFVYSVTVDRITASATIVYDLSFVFELEKHSKFNKVKRWCSWNGKKKSKKPVFDGVMVETSLAFQFTFDHSSTYAVTDSNSTASPSPTSSSSSSDNNAALAGLAALAIIPIALIGLGVAYWYYYMREPALPVLEARGEPYVYGVNKSSPTPYNMGPYRAPEPSPAGFVPNGFMPTPAGYPPAGFM